MENTSTDAMANPVCQSLLGSTVLEPIPEPTVAAKPCLANGDAKLDLEVVLGRDSHILTAESAPVLLNQEPLTLALEAAAVLADTEELLACVTRRKKKKPDVSHDSCKPEDIPVFSHEMNEPGALGLEGPASINVGQDSIRQKESSNSGSTEVPLDALSVPEQEPPKPTQSKSEDNTAVMRILRPRPKIPGTTTVQGIPPSAVNQTFSDSPSVENPAVLQLREDDAISLENRVASEVPENQVPPGVAENVDVGESTLTGDAKASIDSKSIAEEQIKKDHSGTISLEHSDTVQLLENHIEKGHGGDHVREKANESLTCESTVPSSIHQVSDAPCEQGYTVPIQILNCNASKIAVDVPNVVVVSGRSLRPRQRTGMATLRALPQSEMNKTTSDPSSLVISIAPKVPGSEISRGVAEHKYFGLSEDTKASVDPKSIAEEQTTEDNSVALGHHNVQENNNTDKGKACSVDAVQESKKQKETGSSAASSDPPLVPVPVPTKPSRRRLCRAAKMATQMDQHPLGNYEVSSENFVAPPVPKNEISHGEAEHKDSGLNMDVEATSDSKCTAEEQTKEDLSSHIGVEHPDTSGSLGNHTEKGEEPSYDGGDDTTGNQQSLNCKSKVVSSDAPHVTEQEPTEPIQHVDFKAPNMGADASVVVAMPARCLRPRQKAHGMAAVQKMSSAAPSQSLSGPSRMKPDVRQLHENHEASLETPVGPTVPENEVSLVVAKDKDSLAEDAEPTIDSKSTTEKKTKEGLSSPISLEHPNTSHLLGNHIENGQEHSTDEEHDSTGQQASQSLKCGSRVVSSDAPPVPEQERTKPTQSEDCKAPNMAADAPDVMAMPARCLRPRQKAHGMAAVQQMSSSTISDPSSMKLMDAPRLRESHEFTLETSVAVIVPENEVPLVVAKDEDGLAEDAEPSADSKSIAEKKTEEDLSSPITLKHPDASHLLGNHIENRQEHSTDEEHDSTGQKASLSLDCGSRVVSSDAPPVPEQERTKPTQSEDCKAPNVAADAPDVVAMPARCLRPRQKAHGMAAVQQMSLAAPSQSLPDPPNMKLKDVRQLHENHEVSLETHVSPTVPENKVSLVAAKDKEGIAEDAEPLTIDSKSTTEKKTKEDLSIPISLEYPDRSHLLGNHIENGQEHSIDEGHDSMGEQASQSLNCESREMSSDAPPIPVQEPTKPIQSRGCMAPNVAADAPDVVAMPTRCLRSGQKTHGMAAVQEIPSAAPNQTISDPSSMKLMDVPQLLKNHEVSLEEPLAMKEPQNGISVVVAGDKEPVLNDAKVSNGPKSIAEEETKEQPSYSFSSPDSCQLLGNCIEKGKERCAGPGQDPIEQLEISDTTDMPPIPERTKPSQSENSKAVNAVPSRSLRSRRKTCGVATVEGLSLSTTNQIFMDLSSSHNLESSQPLGSAQIPLLASNSMAADPELIKVQSGAAANDGAIAVSGRERKRRLTTAPGLSVAKKIPKIPEDASPDPESSSTLQKDAIDDHAGEPSAGNPVALQADIAERMEPATVATSDLPNGLKATCDPQFGEHESEETAGEKTRVRQRRKTRRLTTVPEESDKTPLNGTLVDIANKSSRRSMRKRRLTQKVTHPLELNSENISPSSEEALTSVESPVKSDPSSSPVSAKKKKISFNEKIECWNPILQEKTWRDICDEIREVPLLKPVPKSKKRANSNDKKKKRRNRASAVIVDLERGEPEDVVNIDGICVPTTLKAPSNLRPVLKPSPVPIALSANAAVEPAKTKYIRKKLVLKNMKQLVEKYGADFSYKGCLKVDGRYHCPDEDCMDNDHRGYNTENVLRNHIKTNHIDVECPTCDECGKSFGSYTRLTQHKLIHSDLPFPCIDCDKSFKTATLLREHSGSHAGFGCWHCKRKCRTKTALVHHFRDTPYRCACCETTLSCCTMLTKHEKEIEHVYRCPVCSEDHSTYSGFLRHTRDAHYGEATIDGRYHCPSCPRRFSFWKNLYRHLRTKHDFVQPAVSLKTKSR